MSSSRHRSALTGGTLAILAVLFVAVIVLVNFMFRGARLDLTEHELYTLSDGTEEIVESIGEPINLYYFFSDRNAADAQPLRSYATRVREMLEEIAGKSGGKINLQVIDPLPFSEEEDRAASFGLTAIPYGNAGETIYFGLAGTNSTDGQMIIPFFQPDKEAFLEYDLAKLIHGLATTTKPVVGLISTLEVGPGFDPATRQMRPGSAIFQSLQELFEVRTLDPEKTTKIEDDIRTLVLVHPKPGDELAYAIDQFVLRGGNLLVMVDPNAELDTSGADPNNPSAAMFANKSSDLPGLFAAWGVQYDPAKVLLDGKHALQVSSPTGQPVRHLAILGFTQDAMSQDDVVSAQLSSVNMQSAGTFKLAENATLKLLPLVQSSDQSMMTPVERIKFAADPATLFAEFVPTKETYVVAGRLQGRLKTAFADKSGDGHLAESKGDVNIVLIADTDVASDRLWVQVQPFLGQQIMNAFANNGDFVVNAIDNLTGSSALIRVRGRATAQRPFTTVNALRREADDRFRAKEQELNRELQETEQKLNELQRGKSAEQALILSPEQKLELERFQDQKVRIRKDLRQVRRQLDAEIESLGSRLKFVNIALMPLLLTLAAAGFALWRRRRPGVA
ncbi:MAG TPA: Gldg family protein [Candidatus Saccharimonadia bacterium]|nr:Gldg family protein [Candidatus Saccharimonadia bacterium]